MDLHQGVFDKNIIIGWLKQKPRDIKRENDSLGKSESETLINIL